MRYQLNSFRPTRRAKKISSVTAAVQTLLFEWAMARQTDKNNMINLDFEHYITMIGTANMQERLVQGLQKRRDLQPNGHFSTNGTIIPDEFVFQIVILDKWWRMCLTV